MTTSEYVEKLRHESEELSAKAEAITEIQHHILPDLSIQLDKNNRPYLISKELAGANAYDINSSCGCCADSFVFVSPYKFIEGLKVYLYPYQRIVGENSAYGIKVWPERFKVFTDMTPEAIKRLEQYLEQHKYREESD